MALSKFNNVKDLVKEMKTQLASILVTVADDCSFDGFDPVAFRKYILSNWSLELLTKALIIFILRGNNIERFVQKGTKSEGQKHMKELLNADVVSKRENKTNVKGNNPVITLARIGAAFPIELLTCARALENNERMRYLLTDDQMLECAAKSGTPIPRIFFMTGLASIVPGQWAEAYVEFSERASIIFKAPEDVRRNTARLTAAIGGNYSVASFADVQAACKDMQLDYPTERNDKPWESLRKRLQGVVTSNVNTASGKLTTFKGF